MTTRTISRRESYAINGSILAAFESLVVTVAATVYREPHFWTRMRTEGQDNLVNDPVIFPSHSVSHRDGVLIYLLKPAVNNYNIKSHPMAKLINY